MKILFYVRRTLPNIGGSEIVVDKLASYFSKLGHEVTVVAPSQNWIKPKKPDTTYELIWHRPFLSRRYDIATHIGYLKRLLVERDFDVVHSHQVYPQSYIVEEAIKKSGKVIPHVITAHGNDCMTSHPRYQDNTMKNRAVKALEKADAFIALSELMQTSVKELAPSLNIEKIHQLPNGVEVSEMQRYTTWRNPGLPEKYLLFIGKLTERKGIATAIRCLPLLHDQSFKLIVAGEGEEKKELQTLCQKLHVEDQVTFIGECSGQWKLELLKNCTALVVPTISWEACSLVTLEGLAAGCVVVGANIGGIKDLIENKENGLLFTPNDPADLADKINFLIANENQLSRISSMAKNSSSKYEWRDIANKHLELYQSLTS